MELLIVIIINDRMLGTLMVKHDKPKNNLGYIIIGSSLVLLYQFSLIIFIKIIIPSFIYIYIDFDFKFYLAAYPFKVVRGCFLF
jgi:hypothetical protein